MCMCVISEQRRLAAAGCSYNFSQSSPTPARPEAVPVGHTQTNSARWPFNLSPRPYSSSIVIKQLSKLCKVGFSKLLWPRFGTRRAAAVHCDRLTELWPRAIFLKMDKKYFDLQLFLLVKLDVASMIFKIHVLHVESHLYVNVRFEQLTWPVQNISFSFRTLFEKLL